MFETRVETSQDSLQKISDFLEKVYQDPINVSKKFEKNISLRTGDILIFV